MYNPADTSKGCKREAKINNVCATAREPTHDRNEHLGRKCSGGVQQHLKPDCVRETRQLEQCAQLSRQEKMQANQNKKMHEVISNPNSG